MNELVDIVYSLLEKGEDVVLARVISVKGSSPRDVGSCMVIRKNGEAAGTVGGGLIEAGVIKKAAGLFDDEGFAILSFDMTGDDLKSSDMVCGGKIEILLEFLPSSKDTLRIFGEMGKNMRASKTSFLITGVPGLEGPSTSLHRWLLSEDDFGACSPDGPEGLLPVFANMLPTLTKPTLVELHWKRYWVDVVRSGGVVYIFGAGHIGREVSDLALRCGFMTVVLDDRSEYASMQRFNKPAQTMVLDSYESCFDGLYIDDNSYIVIVTRGHKYDKQVLWQALNTAAGYIGMIGSIRKRETIYRALVDEGFSAADLERVHCPIGIKMEAETPAEIAVSIVAELINIRAEKRKWAAVKS